MAAIATATRFFFDIGMLSTFRLATFDMHARARRVWGFVWGSVMLAELRGARKRRNAKDSAEVADDHY